MIKNSLLSVSGDEILINVTRHHESSNVAGLQELLVIIAAAIGDYVNHITGLAIKIQVEAKAAIFEEMAIYKLARSIE
ncbi:hypothetical protein THARTR1_01043 [Trichoderma harzianum]|uniref:Uncharacterized protein n=1 Tax=Trichoderma harzianum TaxID=5544 RepID=A0A2K0UNC3_TRIHA|nr:hypothetical protein THARTR1_01043 [Trichoderma harzianum]